MILNFPAHTEFANTTEHYFSFSSPMSFFSFPSGIYIYIRQGVQNSCHRGKGDNVLVIQQGAPNTSATLGAHVGKTKSSTCRHCHLQTQQQVINICTNFCEKGAISPPAIFQEIQEGAQVTSTDRQMHSSTGLPASKSNSIRNHRNFLAMNYAMRSWVTRSGQSTFMAFDGPSGKLISESNMLAHFWHSFPHWPV